VIAIFKVNSWAGDLYANLPTPQKANLCPIRRSNLVERYDQCLMSTRKLIVLALACGLAILGAAAAQLLMAAR
jgi:hypothetical protein